MRISARFELVIILLALVLSLSSHVSSSKAGMADKNNRGDSRDADSSQTYDTATAGDVSGISIEGIWQGTLHVNGAELRIIFHISKDEEGSLTATLDSPDQGATDVPVDSVAFNNGKIFLLVKVAMGVYEGQVTDDLSSIEGNWKQGSFDIPLTLERIKEAPKMNRPQEPKKPYPYDEEEVTIENVEGKVTLAGTLTLPRTEPPFPAVVLITGSGPEDRNETVFGHRPFLVLSDYLTRRGIAVLRVDDRGVGGSSGDQWQSTSEDFASDVIAEVEYLFSRKEIDPARVGLIGHSEGGIIAPMVATKLKGISFIVLMAGTGLKGEEILYLQSELIGKASGQTDEETAKNRRLQERIFNILKSENDSSPMREEMEKVFADAYDDLSAEEKASIPDSASFMDVQVKKVFNPWFRYFIAYDPVPTLKRVRCPVLAINGGKDLQVPADVNLKAIGNALESGRNKDYTTIKLPGLNHLFQTAETGNVSEYSKIEETISPEALKIIGDWVVKHTE